MSLKALLQSDLSQGELKFVRNHFDLIGDIALIYVPEEIAHRKDLIARRLVEGHKNVKTVLRKISDVDGDFRVAGYELLSGNSTETIHKENYCSFRLDPSKVHFSWKLAMERARIASLVKDREDILCPFAGVGPFPVVIARKREVKILALEKNPVAISYFRQNLRLNGVDGKISLIEGDVESILPRLEKKFDRIVMPSPYLKPEERYRYLDMVMPFLKEGGALNSYILAARKEISKLGDTITGRFHGCRVLRVKKCGNFAPGVHRVAVDLLGFERSLNDNLK